jgi:hypothetical protein
MPESPELPQTVRQFVLRHLDSVAELEALLLIRSEEGRPWGAPALAARLYIDERAADHVLTALHRRGLVATADDEGYRYAPGSDTLRAGVDELAQSYPRFLIPITQLIHSKPQSALREFADAFRLRGDA